MYEIIIVSYTHYYKGKHTNLGGPAQHLARYLGDRAYCVWQPIPIGKSQWVYALLKVRDIFLVLLKHRPAKVFIGVEAINALLGRLLGYHRVVYWNMDYSSNRGILWSFLDKLAIKYADEVWVLKDRGVSKQRVVTIGCWFNEIKKLPLSEIDNRGIVYIGLLEDMQGVGLLLEAFREMSDTRLTIIGTGKDENKYKKSADWRVRFTGILSDEEAQEIMCRNAFGWAVYHPDNPTIKTTLPTKPMTYMSCGLVVIDKLPVNFDNLEERREEALRCAKKYDWSNIFSFIERRFM